MLLFLIRRLDLSFLYEKANPEIANCWGRSTYIFGHIEIVVIFFLYLVCMYDNIYNQLKCILRELFND